jgi:hypothetical protein
VLVLRGNVHTSGCLFLLFHLCTVCRLTVSMIHTHTHVLYVGWQIIYVIYIYTTFNNGSLGSRIDEEHSEM